MVIGGHMKRLALILISIPLLFFLGCTATGSQDVSAKEYSNLSGGEGSFPLRSIDITSLEDLERSNIEILGIVRGRGDVSAHEPSDGDSLSYGILETEMDSFGLIGMASLNPYEISLKNAVHAMILECRRLGASFVIFPNYTVEYVCLPDGRDRIITTMEATAVRLLEGKAGKTIEEPSSAVNSNET